MPAPLLARTPARDNLRADNPHQKLALTIREFCQTHGISRGYFYLLKKRGIAPKTIDLGGRVLISTEAAADWRREREGRS
jgi:predicted DNA-binding transcriptional regulator AlpA